MTHHLVGTLLDSQSTKLKTSCIWCHFKKKSHTRDDSLYQASICAGWSWAGEKDSCRATREKEQSGDYPGLPLPGWMTLEEIQPPWAQ